MTATSTDLAQRDEYLDQKLRTAARVVWLTSIAADDDLEPSDGWIVGEADSLRALLFTRGAHPEGRYWDLRRYVLRLLGIAQAYASSSRAVESVAPPIPEPEPTPESEPEPTPEPVASTPMQQWIYGGRMVG